MKKKSFLKYMKNLIKFVLLKVSSGILGIVKFWLKIKNRLKKNIDEKPKILILATENTIGDNIVRMGVVEKFIQTFGDKNTYFLVSPIGYQVLKLIVNNNIYINYPINSNPIRSFCKNLFVKVKIAIEKFDIIVNLAPFSYSYTANFIAETTINAPKCFCSKDLYGMVNNNFLQSQVDVYNLVVDNQNRSEEKICIEDVKPDLTKYLKYNKKGLDILNYEYIALGVGASTKVRMYPEQKFIKIINFLLSLDKKIVFLGQGEKDKNYFEKLVNLQPKLNQHSINFINKLSLGDSFQVLKNAELFIGVDSGLANTAYALGINSVIIYGAGDLGRFLHNASNIHYVMCYTNCFGCCWCCKHTGDLNRAKCIEDINPQDIIEAIEEILGIKPAKIPRTYPVELWNNMKGNNKKPLIKYYYNDKVSFRGNLLTQLHNAYYGKKEGYLIRPVDCLREQYLIYKRPIIIWGVNIGACLDTYKCLKSIGVHITAFVDDKKWYKMLMYRLLFRLPVHTSQSFKKTLMKQHLPYIVIGSSLTYFDETIKEISGLGYIENKDFCAGYISYRIDVS